MKIPVYNHAGEQIREVELREDMFGVPFNNALVHQITVAQGANRRRGTAHTKDRSEVSGGGRKPWRQKGTGRARHGSSRSPLWEGGGVTFGPRTTKGYEQRVPKKMRRKALFMVLSEKLRRGLVVLLEDLSMEKPDTKHIRKVLSLFPATRKGTMLVLPGMKESLLLSARNIPRVHAMQAADLNALDLLRARSLVVFSDCIPIIEKTFGETRAA